MNAKPIFLKEWLKLKKYSVVLTVCAVILGGYFWFDLAGQYANIEPESMMWYRFSHLGDKPYQWLMTVFLVVGAIVAVCQFVPEVIGKKVRILAHLPISLTKVVLFHLGAGLMMILTVNSVIALLVTLAMNHYYPSDIVQMTVRDMLLGQLPAIALYLGLSAVIIEQNWAKRALKIIVTGLVCSIWIKPHYEVFDAVWGLLLLWLAIAVIDSFLSVKTRRIENKAYLLSVALAVIALTMVTGSRMYNQYAVDKAKFYVFHSALLNDFVYQENKPHHQFNYGTTEKSLTKEEFEASLPFVYWKNLDIQKKLPVTVEGQSFDKNKIRTSRMSLQYDHTRQNKHEVALFPFFNPISDKGSIRFPENVLALRKDRFEIFAAETAKPNVALANEVNALAKQHDVAFPIQEVWGKTTNMKPFDWGYFIKDSSDKLFNLRRAENQVHMNAISVPEEIGNIAYVQVSENRHKQFYGYAISKASQVYLISYPDYHFIPLELDGFDYHSMSFQLLSDSLYYLVRYNDGTHYKAVRFSKAFEKIDEVSFR